MKSNYFSKVENKYVFNVSLIFWHIFIGLSSLAIVVSIATFLWCLVPPSERNVEKQPYPEKQLYPEPVKVSLSELKLEEVKQEEALPVPEQVQTAATKTEQPVYEDTKGKTEYENSMNALKNLIPPSKYSWAGAGYWTYPYGERYWMVYKQEKYRQWNVTESDIEEKLKYSYNTADANNYPDKKQILDAFITVVKSLPEEKRLGGLEYLISNVANNVSQSVNICQSLAIVVSKMSNEENIWYINQLASFGKKNKNDGAPFIHFVSAIIDNFDVLQRAKIIEALTNSYYNYFSQNFAKQKEATDLFIPMLTQIKGEYHYKALIQYYGLYLNKNYARDNTITQIENEYQQKIGEIDEQRELERANARMEYKEKKMTKQEYRLKSLMGIGAGILLIVLIATILVFLSIQRSVSKIEEKLSVQNNS
ncbi:MAG TPA: hypothetical protein DCF33_19580 [Saprospirales bacterium]|nr:hypothetical protein [Saprospirales bacterium]